MFNMEKVSKCWHNKIACLILICTTSGTIAEASNLHSVGIDAVYSYLKKCEKEYNITDVELETKNILDRRRKELSKADRSITNRSLFNSYSPEKKIERVSLDGFVLENVSAFDLGLISRMTINNDALYLGVEFWSCGINKSKEADTVVLERKCQRPLYKNYVTKNDLSVYNTEKPCKDALCAAKALFGYDQGVVVLNVLLRFDVLASNIGSNDSESSASTLDLKILSALRAALAAFPTVLLNEVDKTLTFRTTGRYGGAYANAAGHIFNSAKDAPLDMLIYMFYHEIAHGIGSVKGRDTSKEWHKLGEWQKDKLFQLNYSVKKARGGKPGISEYSNKNPNEDFAETFTYYRFAPELLKSNQPEKYAYMKKIYRDIEFEKSICNGISSN